MVKIFVGNVHDSARGEDLRELFQKYGRVTESDVVDGKGFGFVHMETQDEADAAVAGLNGTDLKGRSINVELSTGKPKTRKFPGGGDRGGIRRGGGGGRGPPGRGPGGRDSYGPRGRDYGPPPDPRGRYGDPYGGGARYPPDPYADRNGYYSRAPQGGPYAPMRDGRDSGRSGSMMMPMGGGGAYGRTTGGYDPYDRRAAVSGGMDYGRGDPYAARGADAYGRDPYAARRMSPPRGGGGYYDRRSPPPSGYGGGAYSSSMMGRPRSPPGPRGAATTTRYGDIFDRRAPAPMSRGRSPPRVPYSGGSRY